MEEKELVKDIQWEFSKGKSRAEITRTLQNRGLKLEFIDSIISRAKRPRKIFRGILFSIVLLVFMWVGVYGMFFYQDAEKIDYSPSWINKNLDSEELSLEITPELISLVASEIGAGKLRRNPLNLKKPIMNFQISEENFYTIIDKRIETFEGTSTEADLYFKTNAETIEEIIDSEDIKASVRRAVLSGDKTIDALASEKDLFLKGYLGLYNELS